MLQAIQFMNSPSFECIGLAPPRGRLADALRNQGVDHVPLSLLDEHARRLPREVACQKIVEAIQTVAPAVVHANSLAMGRLTGAVSLRLSQPCVSHLRDIIKLSQSAIRDLNQNRLLLAVSAATRRFLVAQGLADERTRVVYNGIDCEQFSPCRSREKLRHELGLTPHALVLLTVGQIGLRKGLDVLAAAAPAVAARIPDVHFVVVGERNSVKAESVAYEQHLLDEFTRHGLGERFHRLGYRDDVAQLLREADLLIHPARQEPLGRVLLEAAAAGLPIIATAVGGTTEILTDRVSARLVPPDDSSALAQAIVELAFDEPLRQRLAVAAREHIELDFDIRRAATRLSEVWQQVLADHPT